MNKVLIALDSNTTDKKIAILDIKQQKNDALQYHHLSADLKIMKQKLQIRNKEFVQEIKNLNVNTVLKTYEFETKLTKEIQSLNIKLNKNCSCVYCLNKSNK